MADYAITTYDELLQETRELVGTQIGISEDGESLQDFVDRYAKSKGYQYIGNNVYVSGKPTETGRVLQTSREIYNSELDGAKVIDGLVSVSEDLGTGKYVMTYEGTSITAPYTETMYSVFNALGLTLNFTEAGHDAIDGALVKIAKDVFGVENASPATLKDLTFMGLFKDGRTYVDKDVIQAVAQWLIMNGYYDETVSMDVDTPTTAGLYKMEYSMPSSAIITTAYRGYLGSDDPLIFVPSQSTFNSIFNDFNSFCNDNGGRDIYKATLYFAKSYGSLVNDIIILDMCGLNIDENEEVFKHKAYDDGYELNTVLGKNRIAKSYTITENNWYGGVLSQPDPYIYLTTNLLGRNRPSTASNLFTGLPAYEHEDVAVPMEIIAPPQYEIPIDVQYIEWNDDSEPIDVYDPTDPSEPIKTIKYFPLTYPHNNDVQINNQDGNSNTTNIYNYYYNVTYNYPYAVTESNVGNTPSEKNPRESSTHLFRIWNPSDSEMEEFADFLWSSSILEVIENLKKLFENPMDSIISLQELYFPTTQDWGAEKALIYLGNINTDVESHFMAKRYGELYLGYLNYFAKYGNVYDFEPYTTTEIYLPFIGIQQIKTSDVLGAKIHITYRCDYVTGSCVCDLEVERDGSKNLMYEYTGNLAVQLPLTGRNYSQWIANAIGGGANTIGNVISAKSEAGAVGAIVSGVGSTFSSMINSISVTRSGNFSSAFGPMCIKNPFLIITRNIPYQPNNFHMYYGSPANTEVKLGTLHGFTRVKAIHVYNIDGATSAEKTEIENLLREGVELIRV